MAYSVIAFVITLIQVVIVVGSYAARSGNIFYSLLVHGSPFYLLMNLLNSESFLFDKNWIWLALFAYHVIKYFILFRSQFDDRNIFRNSAIVFEAAYLCLSAYYLN